MTEQPSGRFAGEMIEDETEESTGIYRGHRVDEPQSDDIFSAHAEAQEIEEVFSTQVEKQYENLAEPLMLSGDSLEGTPNPETRVNPADLTPRVQKAPTAVGVPPQTQNLFAGETLSETPVVKSGERKAGVAKRSKKASPEFVAALSLESQHANTRRNPFTDTDIAMLPTIKEHDKIIETPKRSSKRRADGGMSLGQRTREFFERTGKVFLGVTVGLLVGALVIGWIALTFGSWQATEQGVYSKTLAAPLNALPEGAKIVMTQVGTVKPEFPATLVPIILNSATSTVVAPIYGESNETVGYTVKCTGGSCAPGLLFDIPLNSIIAQG